MAARAGRGEGRVVTLLTDFGTRDPYVGIVKGVLLRGAPELRAIVDLTHEVPPQDVATAAAHLARAWRCFPAGTIHVAVVDPGVGTERALLLAEREGQLFLAPDNGLLTPVLDGAPPQAVRALDVARVALPRASATFHGRDVLAPAAALLACGASPGELARPVATWVRLPAREARREGSGAVAGEVRWIDRFGNALTDVEAARWGLAPGACRVEVAGRSLVLVRTYAEARPGEALALIESDGWIELAVRQGSAAQALGLEPGTPVRVVPLPQGAPGGPGAPDGTGGAS